MAALTTCSDFGAQENEVCHYFQCPPPICHKVMVLDAIILVFWMLSSKPAFSLSWCFSSFSLSAIQFSSVQSLSRVRLFATPWIAARQASLSITNSWSSLRLTSIKLVLPSSHLILCRPLLLLPPIPPSIRVFSNQSTLRMRWPKDWSFSFSISPSKEHPGLISFRIDWLDLAVQGTLKSLLQHHSSKASILRHSAFFTANKCTASQGDNVEEDNVQSKAEDLVYQINNSYCIIGTLQVRYKDQVMRLLGVWFMQLSIITLYPGFVLCFFFYHLS